ncbi:hypothetical protein ACFW04_011468 [Cataglyphis niger]
MATKETPKVGEDRFASASTTPDPPEGSPSKALNQIRKWGCHFEGKDPVAFLERLEELSASYEIEERYLLLGLPELLKGDALLWYRNSRDDWSTWADFCRDFRTHYLPRGYQLRLKQEIHGRRQKPGEAFDKYATSILTMMRRAGGYTTQEKIEQLYINADPEIQLHVRYEDVTSVSDLCSRATGFEDIDQRRRDQSRRPTDTVATLAAATYDRATCCWRCKQRGHTRLKCRRPARKFCSRCGKDGVLTRECHPPSGNGERVGNEPAVNRPATSS